MVCCHMCAVVSLMQCSGSKPAFACPHSSENQLASYGIQNIEWMLSGSLALYHSILLDELVIGINSQQKQVLLFCWCCVLQVAGLELNAGGRRGGFAGSELHSIMSALSPPLRVFCSRLKTRLFFHSFPELVQCLCSDLCHYAWVTLNTFVTYYSVINLLFAGHCSFESTVYHCNSLHMSLCQAVLVGFSHVDYVSDVRDMSRLIAEQMLGS